jgi:hypothetical protein
VPAAIVSLGLSEHVLSPDAATAIIAAALVSLGICTVGVELLIAHNRKTASESKPSLAATP